MLMSIETICKLDNANAKLAKASANLLLLALLIVFFILAVKAAVYLCTTPLGLMAPLMQVWSTCCVMSKIVQSAI